MVPVAIASLCWSLITSPREGLRKIQDARHQLSAISVRDFFAALWRSYVALISALIYFFQDLGVRWSTMRMITRVVLIVLITSIVALGLTAGWLIKLAKTYRSEQLVTQADVLESQEYKVQAYEKLRSAALLNPANEQVLKRTMETARSLRSPEAVWWGQQLAKHAGETAESMAMVIDYAVDFHQVSIGAQFLAQLQAKHPNSPEAIDTELKLMLSMGQRNRALQRAREHWDAGRETPLVHDIIIGLSNTSNPQLAKEIREHHQKHLMRKDEIGAHLSWLALQEAVPPKDEDVKYDYLAILENLMSMENTERDTLVLAIGRAYEADQLGRDEAIQQMLNQYQLSDSDERIAAFVAMNLFLLGGVEELILQPNDLGRNRQLSNQLMQSLLLSDRTDINRARLLLNLNDRSTALTESDKHFWLAITSLAENDFDQYTIDLSQALDKASIADWQYLESMIRTYTGSRPQLVFYRELYGLTDNNPYTTRQYIQLLYIHGMADEMKMILKNTALEPFRNDPSALSLMIYLNATFGQNLEKCRYLGEAMIDEFPEIYYGYISLAFAYYQSGQPQLAQQLIRSVPLQYNPNELPNYLRFAYAVVMNNPSYLPHERWATLPMEKSLYTPQINPLN